MDLSLLKFALEKHSSCSIEEAISKFADKTVYIYGAGSFGEEICQLLKKFNIVIKGFLDKNARMIEEKSGIKVYSLEDVSATDKRNVAVLLSVVMDKDERRNILSMLKSSGFKSVIEAQSLRCLLVGFNSLSGLSISEYMKSQEKDIDAAAGLFEDEKSKDIYICNVYSHLTRDYSKCEIFESSMREQYFPEDIHLKKGYAHFIDCGGYTGDTILRLIERPEMNSIVSFEPGAENFKKLSDTCDRIQDGNIYITLFPCAVSGSVGMASFTGAGGSGAISEAGGEKVQCAALDKILKNQPVTFIKMDIEGEELNALRGAAGMIERQKPDLAICVYHCIEHLWEIPLYIKKLNPDYKLYLRSYNAYTMETVLYATC